MAVRVRPIALWRQEVDNQTGALARTLEPLASAKANLQIVMGYRLPGDTRRAAIEVYPVTTPRATAAAQAAGLSDAGIAALFVEGDDRPGLGHAIAKAIADAGINMEFFVAQSTGGRHSTVVGFERRQDAERAAPVITKAATAPARRPAARKAAGRKRAGTRKGARKGTRRSR
jgi:hypothetical protein